MYYVLRCYYLLQKSVNILTKVHWSLCIFCLVSLLNCFFLKISFIRQLKTEQIVLVAKMKFFYTFKITMILLLSIHIQLTQSFAKFHLHYCSSSYSCTQKNQAFEKKSFKSRLLQTHFNKFFSQICIYMYCAFR